MMSDIENYASIMLKSNYLNKIEAKDDFADELPHDDVQNEVYTCSLKNQPSEEILTNRKLNNEFKPYGVFIKKTEASSPPIKFYARTNLLFYSQGDRRLEAELISTDHSSRKCNLK